MGEQKVEKRAGWPRAGYLPSGLAYDLRPGDGTDERILLDSSKMLNDGMTEVLLNCLTVLGSWSKEGDPYKRPAPRQRDELRRGIEALCIPDHSFTILDWRIKSIGPVIRTMPIKCVNDRCGKATEYEFDLEELPYRAFPEDEAARRTAVKLSDGRTAVVGYGTQGKSTAGRKLALAKGIIQLGQLDATVAMYTFVEEIEGEEATFDALDRMSYRDRIAVREAIADNGVGIDPEVEFRCPSCYSEQRTRVDMNPGFLYPEASKRIRSS